MSVQGRLGFAVEVDPPFNQVPTIPPLIMRLSYNYASYHPYLVSDRRIELGVDYEDRSVRRSASQYDVLPTEATYR